jgi:hypothetical protein
VPSKFTRARDRENGREDANALSLSILESNMRIFRALALGAALMLATPAVPQQPEPKPVVVEYNIASCGGQDFTVIHVVLNEDHTKLTFGDFLSDATTTKKVDEPLVFDYKEEPKSENGVVQFSAATIYKSHKLTIDGARLGNRVIGVLLLDGDLGHVYYGFIGNHDDITVGVDEAFKSCIEIQQMDQKAIAQRLLEFLFGGSTRPDTTNKS